MTSRTALIFEGGGMRGAYTAALCSEMLEQGVEVPWVGGISAGATNTFNFLTRDPIRSRASYIELARDPRIGGPLSFIRGQGYFNSDFIYHHTSAPDELLPVKWDVYDSTDVSFKIGAFNCETGETTYWGREDMSSREDALTKCQASSSMPVLMPIVNVHGTPYLDGAIGSTGGFAIDAAQADGYERFIVVMTRVRGYRKPPMRAPFSLYQRIFKKYPKVAQAIMDRPKNYNATLRYLERLQQEGRAYLYYPDVMPISNGERNPVKVQACYEEGLFQAKKELPAIMEFLQD